MGMNVLGGVNDTNVSFPDQLVYKVSVGGDKMNCEICGLEVLPNKKFWSGKKWSINAAVIGKYLPIKGHEVCCENVNKLVVLPNRIRMSMMVNA